MKIIKSGIILEEKELEVAAVNKQSHQWCASYRRLVAACLTWFLNDHFPLKGISSPLISNRGASYFLRRVAEIASHLDTVSCKNLLVNHSAISSRASFASIPGYKPGLKPEKIDFSIISQVVIFLNLYRKTTLYLKNIYEKQHFSTSLAPITLEHYDKMNKRVGKILFLYIFTEKVEQILTKLNSSI